MRLAETQALFFSLLQGAPVEPERLSSCFTGTEALPAKKRVGIYVDMVRFRQLDALREEFPKVARLLGEGFQAVAEKYLQHHPSEHASLGQLGRHLPAFLKTQTLPRGDLPEVALLEWTCSQIFVEAEAEPLSVDALGRVAPSEFPGLTLGFIPALTVLSFTHDVVGPWRALEAGEEPAAPLPSKNQVGVWRKGFEVFHVVIAEDEAVALGLARQGAPLAEVCEAFGERDNAAQAAFAALASWLAEGWVAKIGSD